MTKNQEAVLFFAFRYSLTRRTYAGEVVREEILKQQHELSDHFIKMIEKETEKEIDLYQRDEWKELIKKLT